MSSNPNPQTGMKESNKASNTEAIGQTSIDRSWIAEVSHELRLPIANIKLLVETLLDGALEDKETLIRMLNRTNQEVDRLEGLVKDLLSIEHVTQTEEYVQRSEVYLLDASIYAIETTHDLAKSKKIKVKTEVDDNYTIYANPEQFNQVVLNLVENAIKYTPEEGTVTIKSGDAAGCVIVSDTGIGIARDEIPKIFKRFYRVDRTKLRGSTGLGLSIVKHIVDLHGAKITVQSEVSKGSTFKIEFPFDNHDERK